MSIGEVEPDDRRVFLLEFGLLNLPKPLQSALHTQSCPLAVVVNVVILHQIAGHHSGQY